MEEAPHILIIGGGFAGLETALYLRHRLGDHVSLTLVSERNEFIFRPYLCYVPFGLWPERIKIDLIEFSQTHGVHFIQGRVQEIDSDAKEVRIDDKSHTYDALFIATGAGRGPETIPGLWANSYSPWRESDTLLLRGAIHHVLRSALKGERQRVVFLVPPESLWAGPLYEMAFMMERWLKWQQARADVDIIFRTAESTFMPTLGDAIHTALEKAFSKRSIQAFTQQSIAQVEANTLIEADGSNQTYDLLITAPSYVATVQWTGLPTDEKGFIRTEAATRQVVGHPGVYAIGDVSDFPVKQAYVALLQADAAAEHFAANLLDESPAFVFEPMGVWVMEQFDQALVAQVPLDAKGDPDQSSPNEHDVRVEILPVGALRRLHIRSHLPWRFDGNNPLYAGLMWKGTEMGLKVLPYLERESTS